MESHKDLEYRVFTTRAEADKAISSLRGILIGISLDGVITDEELNELDQWCSNHHDLINKNPFKDFINTIRLMMVYDNENRLDLVKDLQWHVQRYEDECIYYNAITYEIQTLQGICHGIISDGIIEDTEVHALYKWLSEHEFLASYYPYDEIKSLLTSILADGIIDEDERKRLFAYFNEFVNIADESTAQKIKDQLIGVEIQGICTSDPNVIFKEKTFCISGLTKRGTRDELSQEIINLGGIVKTGISKKTDYLIVGDNDNPCWAFSCYGRKVEKAIEIRKGGGQIQIIHEFDFWDFIEDAKL